MSDEVMTTANCKEIRRELEETMLGADYSQQVSTHLGQCSACRDYHDKQTKLRQIVGSLGTVAAPADFDFKLRARLANENVSVNDGFHLSSLLGFGQRSVAIAMTLVLLVGAIVFVRYLMTTEKKNPVVATKENVEPVRKEVAPQPEQSPSRSVPEKNEHLASLPSPNSNKDSQRKRTTTATQRSKNSLVAAEFSSERAGVETVFPIDATQQSLKVSLFDKKGNPKTISLPPVSFGSQRVVPTSASYAPKGVW